MKLILSSCDFINPKSRKAIYENLDKPIKENVVLFFPNEKVTNEKIQSRKYHKRLAEYGFLEKNIIVYNYFEKDFCIDKDIDIIYIGGGNTFETFNLIKKSNIDKFIIDKVKNGVIYIGGSCGVHIVSKNFSHIKKYDPCFVNLNNFDGLNLIDAIFVCHYQKDREQDLKYLVSQNKYKVYSMTDEEYIIFKDYR